MAVVAMIGCTPRQPDPPVVPLPEAARSADLLGDLTRFDADIPDVTHHVVVTATGDARAPTPHTVRPGETLSGIADLYLGSTSRWREIAAANPHVNGDGHVQAGQVVVVP